MEKKKFRILFGRFLHLNYLLGFIYALARFLATPRAFFESRRLWAFETWVVFSFWGVYTALFLLEREKISFLKKSRQIILTNLFLLVFPWGLFLLAAPDEIRSVFGFTAVSWRVLGFFSLVGAFVYSAPYLFWRRRFTRAILVFGFIDNLATSFIIFGLLLVKKVPFISFVSIPLLCYFAAFYLSLFRFHRRTVG